MDEQSLIGLDPTADPSAQARTLQYFELLKSSDDGWKLCANVLATGGYKGNDFVRFFCCQVVENYAKTRYSLADNLDQQSMREFLSTLFQIQSQEANKDKNFVRNKIAQIFSLVFVGDYPHRWPTYFSDMLQLLNIHVEPSAIDLYLKILQAIDGEVVDREIVHSEEESSRNTIIKDSMREQCVSQLVDSWYQIITNYDNSNPEITCVCLDVIGSYVSWIDINLVANDRFVSVLLRFLKQPLLRESTCDCILEIVSKGMDPVAKTKLIESFTLVLDSAGVSDPDEEEEGDYLSKLAKLVNGMGIQLIGSWQKLNKYGDVTNSNITMAAIEYKLRLLLRFLGDEDDDVSNMVIPFTHDYLSLLKQLGVLSEKRSDQLKSILYVIFKKMKYDESYNFDQEGEDEAMFQEYRKELKVLFNNVGQLAPDILLVTVHTMVTNTLQNLESSSFQDVELALSMFYLLTEALPNLQNQPPTAVDSAKASVVQEILKLMITCKVSSHPHTAVSLQWFETIVRYEKCFVQESQNIPEVLMSFLDKRGLHHPSAQVRSRVAYLFSRFVKTVRQHLQGYIEEILVYLDDLLVLNSPDNGLHTLTLTSDEQMFIYETASILIVSSQFPPEKKHELMKRLLAPIVTKFDGLLSRMSIETDEKRRYAYARCLQQAMSFASRASKGFSNQQTMKNCGCIETYTETLKVFLNVLNTDTHRQFLYSGIRQFLHRMVVCMESEILPYIPLAMERLLKNADAREMHDFLPLMNQLMQKFKKSILPFLQGVFMPLVSTVYSALSAASEENDQVTRTDKQMLQRGYFLFLTNIVNNNVIDVFAALDPASLQQVLMTIVQGARDIPDPMGQKNCFLILRKLVDVWGGKESCLPGFEEFMYQNIVPACFVAPSQPKFDLTDGQTVLALNESANCMKAILSKRGDELEEYLKSKYLPTLNLPSQAIDEYCQALKSDIKTFRNYLKVFFTQAKS